MSSAPPSAAAHAATLRQIRTRKTNKVREFMTPEGVDLSLEIASAGLRFAALAFDLLIMVALLLALTLAIVFTVGAAAGDVGIIIWLLGFFLLRNFYFVAMELGPRAATFGKRLVGIRVVARDGGRLTVASVVARNLVREVEMFLPFMFMAQAARADMLNFTMGLLGMLWTLGMSLFLLTNKDRMRLGDLIGGTWVVMAKRARLARDMTQDRVSEAEPNGFTREELDVYGVYELQELERILRHGDPRAMRSVADAIRTKIGRPLMGDDRNFLISYYRALKQHQERGLLFGKRRADKYEAAIDHRPPGR